MKILYFAFFYFVNSFLLADQYPENILDQFIRADNLHQQKQGEFKKNLHLSSSATQEIVWFLQGSFLQKSQAVSFFTPYAKSRNLDKSCIEKIIETLPDSDDAYDWDKDMNDI